MTVLRMCDTGIESLRDLLGQYGLSIETVAQSCDIPGSHWGDDEAGLIGSTLYIRPNTPVHSALHEACHWLLMDDKRRARLHTDAGGTAVEENAVCYLQIVLADSLHGVGRARMMSDMDTWGYSFRLGSTKAWFEQDAQDAIAFLQQHPRSAIARLVSGTAIDAEHISAEPVNLSQAKQR